MSERISTGRGPQFGTNDVLPFVQVPAGETPIALERLEVSVLVVGMFAETTQTLTVRNPNRRALEGTLVFPLPDGAVVSGYAIDVDGELVEGVIVPKQEARRILETEIRKGIDPGLVEQVQGNVYRTRIYPLPPSGTRTVRLTYVSDLAVDGTSAAYHLPLGHAKDIGSVQLRVEIKQGEVAPQLSGALGNLTLAKLRDGFVAETTLPRGVASDDLLVRLPDLPRHLRAVESQGDDTFFAISSAIPASTTAWSPRRVAVLWDASGSRGDVERDLAFVSALFDRWPQLVVDVRVVRDVLDDEARSFAGRDELVRFLREAPRDGGTNLAAVDLAALPNAADEAWLIFSDGLATISRGTPAPGAVAAITLSSSPTSDAAYLRHLANQRGGIYIDLLQTSVEAAIELVATARDGLHLASATGCADVHVRRVASRLSIIGRLTADIAQVRLTGSGAPDDHISIPRAMAVDSHLVARAWAGQQTRALAVTDPDAPEILALARRHQVVTANASLLVLDTLAQHLEYGIEPAASRKTLREQYLRARERERRDEQKTKSGHLDAVHALWQARIRWWETNFEALPPSNKKKKGAAPRDGRPDRLLALEELELECGAPAEMDDGIAPRLEMSLEGAGPPPPRPAPMPAMAMAMAPPAMTMAAMADAGGAAMERERDVSPSHAGGSIQIQAWTPDTPYLTKLRASADPYATFLAERPRYATSPAFFVDCGDFFLGKGERALGLRILSNVLELGLDDAALMRMYAWRIQQAGSLDAAIDVLERVRKMREDEPQSHRDLALALAERWEQSGTEADITRAMNLLYDVVEREWERFPEIELIALMELNRLIARSRARDIATPERIDTRFIRLLDLDLRISLAWDLDLTDVDLHVFEPNGEHAYYGQNTTSGGGLVSRDFREGYGPEEYVRRRAEPGIYTIKAHYYGSHQQSIAGACTVIVQVVLDFGRPNEERQFLTLRLDRPSDQVRVGEVTFAGRAQAADWRPRFKSLRRGMAIDEIANVVGQPTRVTGSAVTILVYELPGGDVVHVHVAPRLTAVKQILDGAELDLI